MSGNTKYIIHNGHNYIESGKVQERFGITTNIRFSQGSHINKPCKKTN